MTIKDFHSCFLQSHFIWDKKDFRTINLNTMKDVLRKMRPIYIGMAIIWLFCFISAVLQPSLNDPPVFWNWAQQVHDSDLSGMDAIESVWEIKGLLSRIIYYQLFLITSIFSSAFYPTGHFIFTAIGLLEMTIIIGLSIFLIPAKYLDKSAKVLSIFLATIAIYSTSAFSNMQPELWGYTLLLLSFCILLRENITARIIGGILMGMLFFVKTPYLLLAGSSFFAFALITHRGFWQTVQVIWIYALSAFMTICVILVSLYINYPIEIHDIFVLPHYYGNLLSLPPTQILQAFGNGFSQILEIPLHVPVVLLGSISLFMYLGVHRFKENVFILCMWLFPYLYIVISNRYFIYHYNVMLFPAIVSIYLSREKWGNLSWGYILLFMILGIVLGLACSRASFYVLCTLLLAYIIAIPYILMALTLVEKWQKNCLYIAVIFATFVFASFQSGFSYASRYAQHEVQTMVLSNLEKGYPVGGKIGDSEVLHLTDGIDELWVGNKSYLRYLYPAPLASSSFMKYAEGVELQEKILDYKGNILILAEGYSEFLKKNAPEIMEFIDHNYTPYDTIYQVYSLFRLYEKKPIGHADIVIYHKKID